MKNKMRYFWLIAAFAVSAMIFTACNNDTTRDPVPPTITTEANLGNFAVDVKLEGITLVATGDRPIRWALVEGQSLPPGLELSAAGVISGTPTVKDTFNFNIRATNDEGYDTRRFSMTIMLPTAPVIDTPIPQLDAVRGEAMTAHTVTLLVQGTGTVEWSLYGTPPAGISINQSGVISGTPTEDGTFNFTVRAENVVGHDEAPVTMEVTVPVPPVAPTITSTVTSATIALGQAFTHHVTADGHPAPTFGISGHPLGLGINSTTGVFYGTPETAGTYTITITASNGVTPNATQNFTLNITHSVRFTESGGEKTIYAPATGFDGTEIIIPAAINGVPVTTIGVGAFNRNVTLLVSLTSVVIPYGVTTIEGSAFYNNELTSIVIPNSVTTIGFLAFRENPLLSITIPSGITLVQGALTASFGDGFDMQYMTTGQLAGTYTRDNTGVTVWDFTAAP